MKRISRRTLLRGATGAVLALPMLECMLPARNAYAVTPPKRYLLTFGGFSLNKGLNGVPAPQAFVPDNYGPGYDLKAAVTNLQPVASEVTFVSGLDIPHATDVSTMPPASRYIGDSFHFHTGPLLCGVKQQYELDAEVIGPSSDQLVWPVIYGNTFHKCLCYRVQASYYNASMGAGGGRHHRDTMSFEDLGGGQIQDIEPQTSPKQAWSKLTTSFGADEPAKQLELRKRKSVLDLVDRDMAGLLPKLGAWDRQRIERHYDEVRALEQLLNAPAPQCTPMPEPPPDPAIGGDFQQAFDYSASLGYSGENERADTFAKVVHMAFKCDLSRVCTLMYTIFQSFMNINPITGASFNLHAMNHNGTQTQLNEIINWHMKKFADLIVLLRDEEELPGVSLLDNCAVAFIPEGGFRTATGTIPGGISHNTENMCLLVAGGAGGLRRGEHIQAPSGARHPANVLISLMKAVGVPSTTLGEISGHIPGLF